MNVTWLILALPSIREASDFVDDYPMDDRLEDIIRDVGAESFAKVVFENV